MAASSTSIVTEARTPTMFFSQGTTDNVASSVSSKQKLSKSSQGSSRGGRGSRSGRGRGKESSLLDQISKAKRKHISPSHTQPLHKRRGSLPNLDEIDSDSDSSDGENVSKSDIIKLVKLAVRESINPLSEKIDKLTQTLECKNKEVETLTLRLSESEAKLTKTMNKLDKLEQYTRRSSVRIHNVDKSKWESNYQDLVEELASNMETDMSPENIIKCHPVGQSSDDNKCQLLVKFQNEKIRDNFLKNKKTLNNVPSLKHIRINEDLTPTRHYILRQMLKLRSDGLIDSVWSYNGTINYKFESLGKKFVLDTESELNELTKKLRGE